MSYTKGEWTLIDGDLRSADDLLIRFNGIAKPQMPDDEAKGNTAHVHALHNACEPGGSIALLLEAANGVIKDLLHFAVDTNRVEGDAVYARRGDLRDAIAAVERDLQGGQE